MHAHGITGLVIVGLTTDHCASTATRMAGNLGFNVRLFSDATATFNRPSAARRLITADEIHEIYLASLHNEFCEVCSTAQVLNMF